METYRIEFGKIVKNKFVMESKHHVDADSYIEAVEIAENYPEECVWRIFVEDCDDEGILASNYEIYKVVHGDSTSELKDEEIEVASLQNAIDYAKSKGEYYKVIDINTDDVLLGSKVFETTPIKYWFLFGDEIRNGWVYANGQQAKIKYLTYDDVEDAVQYAKNQLVGGKIKYWRIIGKKNGFDENNFGLNKKTSQTKEYQIILGDYIQNDMLYATPTVKAASITYHFASDKEAVDFAAETTHKHFRVVQKESGLDYKSYDQNFNNVYTDGFGTQFDCTTTLSGALADAFTKGYDMFHNFFLVKNGKQIVASDQGNNTAKFRLETQFGNLLINIDDEKEVIEAMSLIIALLSDKKNMDISAIKMYKDGNFIPTNDWLFGANKISIIDLIKYGKVGNQFNSVIEHDIIRGGGLIKQDFTIEAQREIARRNWKFYEDIKQEKVNDKMFDKNGNVNKVYQNELLKSLAEVAGKMSENLPKTETQKPEVQKEVPSLENLQDQLTKIVNDLEKSSKFKKTTEALNKSTVAAIKDYPVYPENQRKMVSTKTMYAALGIDEGEVEKMQQYAINTASNSTIGYVPVVGTTPVNGTYPGQYVVIMPNGTTVPYDQSIHQQAYPTSIPGTWLEPRAMLTELNKEVEDLKNKISSFEEENKKLKSFDEKGFEFSDGGVTFVISPKEKTFFQKELSAIEQAAINSGAKLASKTFKSAFLSLIQTISPENYDSYSAIMDSEMGLMIISMGLGQIIANLPYIKDNDYMVRFADAFKVQAYEMALSLILEYGKEIAEKIMKPIIDAAQKAVPSLKQDEQIQKARVLFDNSEELYEILSDNTETITASG